MRLLLVLLAGALLLAHVCAPRAAPRLFSAPLAAWAAWAEVPRPAAADRRAPAVAARLAEAPGAPPLSAAQKLRGFDAGRAAPLLPGVALLLGLGLGFGGARRVAALQTAGAETVGAISSRDEFYEKLGASRSGKKSGHPDGDLMCIKFYASWCKSCKAIAPKYSALAEKYSDQADFYEMMFTTTKDMKELFSELKVKKTPCVQFYRGDKGRLATIVCGPKHWTDVGKNLDMYLNEDLEEPLECVLNDDLTECTDVSAL